ncbi:MAG: hypothetical protein U9O20_01415 [Patescibacteria group bacterium]|nr:hypothetical protein [Patescibacteria group bacterium]
MRKKQLLSLVTLSFIFLLTAGVFGFFSPVHAVAIPNGTGLPDPGGVNPVITVTTTVLGWILIVFLMLSIISFIVTGIQYLLSFGSTSMAENAKHNFVYSIIAVTIVCGALIIVYTIEYLLS